MLDVFSRTCRPFVCCSRLPADHHPVVWVATFCGTVPHTLEGSSRSESFPSSIRCLPRTREEPGAEP